MVPLLAGACVALPLPVQVASMVIDGVSYLVTQKSISDHGISALAGKDCALYRGLTMDPVCREHTGGMGKALVEDWESEGRPVRTNTVAANEAPADGRLYYVLGSFARPSNAQELAGLIRDLSPSLLATRAGNKRIYHVIVGPIGPGGKKAWQQRIAQAGFYEVRAFAMAPMTPEPRHAQPNTGPNSGRDTPSASRATTPAS